MEKKTKIKITIDFHRNGKNIVHIENESSNNTAILVNRTGAETIDGCVKAILELAYPVMRKHMSKRLSKISKKKFFSS